MPILPPLNALGRVLAGGGVEAAAAFVRRDFRGIVIRQAILRLFPELTMPQAIRLAQLAREATAAARLAQQSVFTGGVFGGEIPINPFLGETVLQGGGILWEFEVTIPGTGRRIRLDIITSIDSTPLSAFLDAVSEAQRIVGEYAEDFPGSTPADVQPGGVQLLTVQSSL